MHVDGWDKDKEGGRKEGINKIQANALRTYSGDSNTRYKLFIESFDRWHRYYA